ncbi:MAG: methionyl-tRNA formyltransferase [Treponema sp.]|nr:methionyl-tRNA formyltransferase [Treponema sp.]
MKIIYAGSPIAAKETLQILVENQKAYGFETAGVLSNPPSAQGRHKELVNTPVAQYAIEKGIPLFTPGHLDSQAREQILPLGADLLVCFAYGHIFGPKFLEMFRMGGINLHPSLLPKYRGCTPVPAAILNRDKETGFTVQRLSLKMDEGEILAQKKVILNQTETADSLLHDAAVEGGKLILELIKNASLNGNLEKGVSQNGDSSYTVQITKEDARIDWNKSAVEIEAKVRAYYSEPCCWTTEKGQPLKIHKSKVIQNYNGEYESEPVGKVLLFDKNEGIFVKTGNGILSLLILQKQGKKAMNYKDFMNGARDFTGTVLGANDGNY